MELYSMLTSIITLAFILALGALFVRFYKRFHDLLKFLFEKMKSH